MKSKLSSVCFFLQLILISDNINDIIEKNSKRKKEDVMGEELDKNLSVKTMVVLRKAMRSIDSQVYSEFKDYGITPTQFGVLDVLYTKGEMKICRLIDSMLATSGNMTVVIKNMERHGWIYRQVSPDDRRASVVGLTETGRDLIETILPQHIASVNQVFAHLTDEEKSSLITILKKFKKSEAK